MRYFLHTLFAITISVTGKKGGENTFLSVLSGGLQIQGLSRSGLRQVTQTQKTDQWVP